jgi:hypothetical protein
VARTTTAGTTTARRPPEVQGYVPAATVGAILAGDRWTEMHARIAAMAGDLPLEPVFSVIELAMSADGEGAR